MAGGGGLDALQNAMIIGALPFTVIMVLMCLALGKALLRDDARDGHLSPRQLKRRQHELDLLTDKDYGYQADAPIEYRPLTRDEKVN